MAPSAPTRQDYEYVRQGTRRPRTDSSCEPKAGQRVVSVTDHRGKTDFVGFVQGLLTDTYATARRVHLVLDNLNIHFRKCFDDVLGKRAAGKLLRRVRLPLHAQARKLAQHGSDRDRHPHAPMLEAASRKPATSEARSCCLANRSKRATTNYRVEVHPTGRRPETRAPLCFETYMLMY